MEDALPKKGVKPGIGGDVPAAGATTPTASLYSLHFSRDRIIIASYSDDAIRAKVETWADTETALA